MHMIMSFFIKYHKLGTKDASSTFIGICVEGMLYWGTRSYSGERRVLLSCNCLVKLKKGTRVGAIVWGGVRKLCGYVYIARSGIWAFSAFIISLLINLDMV